MPFVAHKNKPQKERINFNFKRAFNNVLFNMEADGKRFTS